MPKGYFVATDIQVVHPGAEFDEYRSKVGATIAAFGGRVLTVGSEPRLLEGDDPIRPVIVVEFESPERTMQWYNSPEYQTILPLRLRNVNARSICVAGI